MEMPREQWPGSRGQAQHCLPGLSPALPALPCPSPLRSSPSLTGLTGRAVMVAGGQTTVAASPSLPQGLLEGRRRRVPQSHQLGIFRGSPKFSFFMGPLHTAALLLEVSSLLIKYTPLCEGSLSPCTHPLALPHLSAQPPSPSPFQAWAVSPSIRLRGGPCRSREGVKLHYVI